MTDAAILARLVRLEILAAELGAIVDRLVYASALDDTRLVIEARALAQVAAAGLARLDQQIPKGAS